MNTLHQAGALLTHRASLLSPLPPMRELVASVNLSAVVERYAGPGKRSGRGWLFQCPNPSHPDSSPSFSVFVGNKGVEQCHCLSQCGHIGDAVSFLRWINNYTDREAAEELRGFAGIAAPKQTLQAQSKPRVLRATKASGLIDDAQALKNYLAARGWPEEVAQTFGLQVMQDYEGVKRVRHPFMAWVDGKLTEAGWQARRLDKVKARKWWGELDTPLPIYNLPALDAEGLTHAVICEGPADTITATLALSTLPGWACVGIAGANGWREEFAQYFGGLAVVIAGDNDKSGESMTAKLVKSLNGVASLIVAACPTSNDLTDMAKEQSLEAVRELLTGWHYIKKHAIESDTSTPNIAAVIEVPGFIRCKVCKREAALGANFCNSCKRIELVSGKPWRVCDTCNTFALAHLERKCFVSHKCTGHFAEAVCS